MQWPPALARRSLASLLMVSGCWSAIHASGAVRAQTVAEPPARAAVKLPTTRAVPPEINEAFVNPDLNVDEFVDRFEGESREVYAQRRQILDALQLKPGMRVADVGAGTGFFSRLIATAVGPQGWVYAVDISPALIKHIARVNQQVEIANITGVLCAEDSINLPAASVDLAFVCDTYHHFAYPDRTLASIHRALRSDGVLVVVDFEREVGKSREWILEHVRAGKSEFSSEIQTAGFEPPEEVQIEGFEENYLVRFRKSP